MDRFQIGHEIGKGAFGDVFYAIHKASGEERAIKRIRNTENLSWDDIVMMRELQSMMQICLHPNIVRIYEVHSSDTTDMMFVLEYMTDGSLHDLLMAQRRKRQDLPVHRIRSIVQQILKGLEHMHQRGCMHRDIKPENILLSGQHCKIADFSLARRFLRNTNQDFQELTSYVSTRWYRAPEVLQYTSSSSNNNNNNKSSNQQCPYGSAVDMFATGCVMAELYNLAPLFPGRTEIDQLHRIFSVLGTTTSTPDNNAILNVIGPTTTTTTAPRTRLEQCVQTATSTAIDLLLGLLHLDPQRRFTAKQALGHAYYCAGDSEDHQNKDFAKSSTCSGTTSSTRASAATTTATTPASSVNTSSTIVTVSPANAPLQRRYILSSQQQPQQQSQTYTQDPSGTSTTTATKNPYAVAKKRPFEEQTQQHRGHQSFSLSPVLNNPYSQRSANKKASPF